MAEATKVQLETIQDILAQGTQADILKFLKTNNLQNKSIFNFSSVYWLLKDKEFFFPFIEILREKNIFDLTTWSYGIFHKDARIIQEYFNSPEVTKHFTGGKFFNFMNSSLLKIDNFKLHEFHPLVN